MWGYRRAGEPHTGDYEDYRVGEIVEENQTDLILKIAIVLGVCVVGAVYLLTINHGEGDPYFVFYEVPFNDTFNNSVIHLEDKDIMNVRGLDVKQNDSKISRIYFRYSDTTPEISSQDFYLKYGSPPYNQSLRKYLEYKGVYYIARMQIP